MSSTYPTYPSPYASPLTSPTRITPVMSEPRRPAGMLLAVTIGAAVLLGGTAAGAVVDLRSANSDKAQLQASFRTEHAARVSAEGDAAAAQIDAAEARSEIAAANSNAAGSALAAGLAQHRTDQANANSVLASQAAAAANARANADANRANSNATAADAARSAEAQKAQGLTDFRACMTALDEYLHGDDSAASRFNTSCRAVVNDLS
jgi:hypothetical protein